MNNGVRMFEEFSAAPERRYTGGVFGILFVGANLGYWGLTCYSARWSGLMAGVSLCWAGLVALGMAGCFNRERRSWRLIIGGGFMLFAAGALVLMSPPGV